MMEMILLMILLTWTTLPMAWNAGMLLSSANWMNLEHQEDFREGCCHRHQGHYGHWSSSSANWMNLERQVDFTAECCLHHQCHYDHHPPPTWWTCHINWISEQDSQDTVIIISSSARINLVPQNTLVGFYFHYPKHSTTIIIMTSACKLISGSIAISTSIIEDILITCSQ